MDAYASVAHPASRIYFMLFYLFTMVVLTIVVASVLEAFRFRIQYKKQTSKRDGEWKLFKARKNQYACTFLWENMTFYCITEEKSWIF